MANIWWRSAKWPRGLDGEKKKKRQQQNSWQHDDHEIFAAFHVFVIEVYQLVSYCRENAADEMRNACPPQQTTYHGMIIEDRPPHAMPSGDLNIQQDISRVSELQRDGYGDGSGERWMMSGHSHRDGNPDPSFRPHYSGFDERAVCDGMTWRSQEEVRASMLYIALFCLTRT